MNFSRGQGVSVSPAVFAYRVQLCDESRLVCSSLSMYLAEALLCRHAAFYSAMRLRAGFITVHCWQPARVCTSSELVLIKLTLLENFYRYACLTGSTYKLCTTLANTETNKRSKSHSTATTA
jgi:hypothetical protein